MCNNLISIFKNDPNVVLQDSKRSATLPVLNYETDTPGGCTNSDELARNLKKINNGIKHLLSRESEASNLVANEWKLIGIIMDRLLFWTFFTITVSSSCFLLIVLPVLKHQDLIWAVFGIFFDALWDDFDSSYIFMKETIL